MHTIDDIKKYQSYGFHLIPMGMDKKPKTKRTGKNGHFNKRSNEQA